MALEREAIEPERPGNWLKAHSAGLTAAALGLSSIAIAAILCYGGDEVVRIPNPLVTTPFLVGALTAGLASLIRKERVYSLPIGGVAMAGAAMVLGWAVVVAVIAAVTAAVILLMSHMM